jgi:DNA-binding transcriptional regulator YiaG
MTIKEARIAANLTQRQLSDLLEIPLRTVENWEGGKSNPPAYVKKLVIEKLISLSSTHE